jgi:hypothetical protein
LYQEARQKANLLVLFEVLGKEAKAIEEKASKKQDSLNYLLYLHDPFAL